MTSRIVRRTFLSAVVLFAFVASLAQAGQAAKFDVTGVWAFEVNTEAGAGAPTMTFKQEGETLTGKYAGTFGEADLTGTVKGADIAFSFSGDIQGQTITSNYKGTIESATSMKGTLEIVGLGAGSFTATKK
jgi:hypothetical protein